MRPEQNDNFWQNQVAPASVSTGAIVGAVAAAFTYN